MITQVLFLNVFFLMNLRKIKGPNDAPQLHVAEIRNKAKQCTTLNCLGEKCYELKPFVKIHYLSNIKDFAKEYEIDLKRRGWYENQN